MKVIFRTAFSRIWKSLSGVKTTLSALSLLFATQLWCAAETVRGRVTCEGKPLEGIVVSDGMTCTATDERGKYTLEAYPGSRQVFVSVPSGYLPELAEGSIPVFFRDTAPVCDFSLRRNPADDSSHIFFVQADVQLTSRADLKAYSVLLDDMISIRDSMLASFPAGKAPDVFGLDCGDIVGDSPSLYPGYIKTASELRMPVYRAIGNHDMDYRGRSHETSVRTFSGYFGPTRYSFNKGEVHYVVIDNNFYLGRDYFYIGYVDEATFSWLEEDLSYVPEGSTVVLLMHIPSRLTPAEEPFSYSYGALADRTVNAQALHAVLSEYDAHIISGHMHYNLNVCFSDSLMEHNTASVCGTWWCTPVCLDGTPSGYGIYVVEGDSVRWVYKGAGYPLSYQGRSYLPGTTEEYPDLLVANVWNWDPAWKVEWLEDGKVMGEMERFTGYDPLAASVCSDRTVIRYDWISPALTPHLFRALPLDPSASLKVRVTDRFGQVFEF